MPMNCHSIGEKVAQAVSTLPEWKNLEEFVASFSVGWRQLGQTLQQQLVQEKIEDTEAQYLGTRTKRRKRYYTPLGEMVVWRRVYPSPDGYQVKADLELGLPSCKWLPQVLELACALGVTSEFPNAHKLFQQWTGIELTEKTLANQVEAAGLGLQEAEDVGEIKSGQHTENSNPPVTEKPEKLYVGVDGVMTQRLKQAGMHWSQRGAEGVMALRAAYLSSSNRWSTIWSSRSQLEVS